MHPRSTLSKPSPKRSLSCAGLDDLEELLHSSDTARAPPNRKRHHSLNSDNNFAATNFGTPSSPSRHEYQPPPASYPGALRRPELPTFSEKNSSSGGFQLVSSTSSSFESRYPQTSSNQSQPMDRQHSDGQDNNYQDEHDFDSEFSGQDASSGDDHEYKSSGHFSSTALPSQDPQDSFEHRLKLDHDPLAGKRLDHSVFLPHSHRTAGSECSPREEFLVQAFGPSGFKLHGTSVSSNDDLDDSLSDDSSNNREHSASGHAAAMTDADTELKMSFNELEADIRGAMHQNPHHQQHSPRLPELTGLSHQPFASPSHGSFGLNRTAIFPRSNQEVHHVAMFGQSQDVRPHLIQTQKDTGFFSREQHHQSPSRASLAKTPQSKGASAVQTPTKWLRDEDERLRVAVARFGGKNWKMIAETLGNGRTDVQCLHRWNKVLKPGLIKGPWTPEEDRILTSLITRYGVGKIRWCDLALHLPGRIGKQCRERWCNHLDSRIRKGQWTPEEDDMVFRWQQKLGNKWSEIAKLLPGRTENAVKNRFNSAARRKWLMNQANKSAAAAAAQSTPPAPNPSQVSPHQQLQQHTLMQSSSAHQEGNVYNVNTMPYGGGKVSPLPSTDALMEHHPHNMIPPLGRQNFIQHYTSPTNALLPGGPVFRPVGNDQSFDHDKSAEVGKGDSMPLAPPPTFVPPPLNSLFHPPPVNIATGSSRNLQHLVSPASGASLTPVFPFPSHLPTSTHSASSSVILPASKSMSGDDKDVDSSILPLKEEKLERDDLVLQATPASSSGPDPSVPMDDENMNSFLDSVALELDDIME
ncbi:hypothetical protein F441_21673 [Phytophthora nicotianae CJ01A1]|uniref:Uncharacterized protein n=6 Tax=Phytophthora nicotianae TaxID=4792 RepID=W2QV42_PHYN3|nr:hypothetical protein PPTG_06498 [Phytophthora nicotianae INRA-310]ETI31208.1 hypothetical protein F443_21792 [Phytophthora nicotianae P1569]ETK71608.1 hypothetical protein L915_21185 [Phytophthora nicotianae]ETO59930.1 hypothetical protein F444_21814 [Phytophthora nicotianae P1976]ETP01027.1 hypothetical protein F441_21673 [Phytophthora nicotianae CJ01A1]ETP29165.1 hypothetical protein F442_21650 [Phytophthora nicotianae P10297]